MGFLRGVDYNSPLLIAYEGQAQSAKWVDAVRRAAVEPRSLL